MFSMFRHSWRYVAHMLDLMTLDTTQRKQYVCWSDQSNQCRYSTRVMLGNEELVFVEEFRNLGHVMTADCRDDKDINKKIIQEAKCSWQICWSGSSQLHLLRQKSNFSNHIVTSIMDVLFGVINTRTLLENLLSVIVTHSSVLFTSPDTPTRVWFAMNATDHINVVFRKFAYSLMSRVTASPNSIVTAIVNGDSYHVSTDV